ncbi:MAG TPA: hypothetical protein VLX31_13765 [Streptosporangiaceae bacterium]|nr:hypothetical protein [Streptosporangiaceae bacterium]
MRVLAVFAATVVLLAGCASGAGSGQRSDRRSAGSVTPRLTDPVLSAVVAVSPRLAWAVGSVRSGVLIVRWTGTAWQEARVPRTGAGSTLTSVTAVSDRDAWASGTDGGGKPLILHWNGTAWTRTTGPGLSAGKRLFSIAAVAPNVAWAVGGFPGGYCGYQSAFIAGWKESAWTRQASSDAGPLSAVTAGPAGQTWAVGGCLGTVIYRRERSGWKRVPSPSPADVGDDAVSFLDGVIATSARNAWAVGAIAGTSNRPLILHWDGTRWIQVPSPFARGQLHAVAATSATSAWAAGLTFARTRTSSLLLRWNGTRWTRVPCPGKGLTGLTAITADSAWAVGTAGTGPLILHWNGIRWKQQPL